MVLVSPTLNEQGEENMGLPIHPLLVRIICTLAIAKLNIARLYKLEETPARFSCQPRPSSLPLSVEICCVYLQKLQ